MKVGVVDPTSRSSTIYETFGTDIRRPGGPGSQAVIFYPFAVVTGSPVLILLNLVPRYSSWTTPPVISGNQRSSTGPGSTRDEPRGPLTL